MKNLTLITLILSILQNAEAVVPASLVGSWQAIKPTSENGGQSTSVLTIRFTSSKVSYISDCQSRSNGKTSVSVTTGVSIDLSRKIFTPTGEGRKQVSFDGGYYCYVTVDTSPSRYQLVGSTTLKVKDEGMDWVTYRKIGNK